jgi:acyl-CoA synthetase (AMP-forming)/AMP-acid ligase II
MWRNEQYALGTTESLEPDFTLSNMIALLRWRALNQPDERAYTFLKDGDVEDGYVTYGDLDKQARAIAAWLQADGLRGERALMIYPSGLEFIAGFFGCLYAGVIAIPVSPVNPAHPQRSLPKLRSIIADAQPRVTLTTSRMRPKIDEMFSQAKDLKYMGSVATDSISEDLEEDWQEGATSGEAVAYLQYTSGSTSMSKGVKISHANVLQNSRDLDRGWVHGANTVVLSWLPHFHDMGLVYGIIQPMYKGARCYLMSPASFIQRPLNWLQAISRYRATHSGAPNFAYDLCVRKISPRQRESLDLSCWNVAFNGAEPIRKATLDRFAEAFEPCGFRWRSLCPSYGLAEATLKVTTTEHGDGPVFCKVQANELEQDRVSETFADGEGVRVLVGCGRPSPGTRVEIVDPVLLTRCPPDKVGEVWISSSSVSAGYWNRPDESDRIFGAHLIDTGEGPFLRSGDLGFVRDGQLYITGRLKDMIIVAGRNHYPQDIEFTVEQSHAAIRPGGCAAFSLDVDGEEQVVLFAEVDRHFKPVIESEEKISLEVVNPRVDAGPQTSALSKTRTLIDPADVVRTIRRAVSEYHELQLHEVVLVKPGSVPKTSSGKLQRHACRNNYLARSFEPWG